MQIYHCGCDLNIRLSPHYVNRACAREPLPLTCQQPAVWLLMRALLAYPSLCQLPPVM